MVYAKSMDRSESSHLNTEIAVFGGGCFWCTEAIFQRLRGVLQVTPGYAGGHSANPTYQQVSSEETGHAEVIKVEFDPKQITFDQLLDIFWHLHDPTSLNQQGADVGTQYRSIILYTTPEQAEIARHSKQALAESSEFDQPIVTEIKPLDQFYLAEKYHHNYFENNKDQPYCQLVISPKLSKLVKKYSHLLNEAE